MAIKDSRFSIDKVVGDLLADELPDDLVVEALALVQAEGLDGAGRRWRIRN